MIDHICIGCQGQGTVYTGDYGTMLADDCLECGGTGLVPISDDLSLDAVNGDGRDSQ